MTARDEFSAIAPQAQSVVFRGQAYEIGPLKVGTLPAFARAIRPMIGRIESGLNGQSGVSADLIVDLIGDHGENLLEATHVATGIPRAEIDAADLAEFLELVPIVLRVNRDFLNGRLSPAIQAAVSKTVQAVPGAGPTP